MVIQDKVLNWLKNGNHVQEMEIIGKTIKFKSQIHLRNIIAHGPTTITSK